MTVRVFGYGSARPPARDPLRIVTSVPSVFFFSGDVGVSSSQTGVSLWSDLSGNGRDLSQGTVASQPAYTPSGFGGRGSLLFDGLDDVLVMSYVPPAPSTTVSWYWLVFNPVVGGNGNTIFASNNTNRHRFYWGNSTVMSMSNGSGVNSGPVTANRWYRGEVLFTNTTSDYRKVGPDLVTNANAGANAGVSNFTLGGNNITPSSPSLVSVAAFGCWAGEPSSYEKMLLDEWVFGYYNGLVSL
jgi:hypothetical protein